LATLPSSWLRQIAHQRRILAIIGVFVVLISTMVGYNASGLSRQRATPLVVDVTSRQRAFVERYMKDVLLKVDGEHADPGQDQKALESSAQALLHGGLVPSPQGNLDDLVRVPPPANATVRIKLAHEQDLIFQLVDDGNTLLLIGKSSPSYQPTLFLMRLTGAQLSSVTGDAAGEEARAARGSLTHLLRVEIVLGFLGAAAAVGMGLLLLRTARRQSARFRSLVHNAADLITVIDENATAIYQSPSAERVLGYAPSDVIGTKLTELLHPSDKQAVIKAFADIYDQPGATVEVAFRLRHRDGTWVAMEGTVLNLVRDATVGGFVVNSRDVTERERAAAALRIARDQAMEASRMKSTFLASMSHEIRTPMNAVIGLTDLLLDTPLGEQQRTYATGVQNASENLLGIINDILDFSKVEAGKMNLEVVDLDLGALLEDVVALFAQGTQAQPVELLAHRRSDVPTRLQGDPTRLRQVLVNLMSNAVKFTSAGEVVLSASLVAETPTVATVRFEVADTGIGIAPEDQARMFDPFSQADASTTRRYGGTGLGLAIVKQLIELMGGQLGVDSEVNRGSRFWFELPLTKQQSDATSEPPSEPDLGAVRALIVDDNATNRLILREQLTSWGMEPDETPDGLAALSRMRDAATGGHPYEIVVLDLNMPDMDGLELARHIRDETSISAAELFLLSSSGQVDDQTVAQYGLAGSLTKPVRQSELFNCIATALQHPNQPPADATLAIGAGPSAHRGHLLLVEDNEMNQLVATKTLERLGYSADVANSGREALTAVAVNRYDAVLMDCQMPDMDGYEATQELRQRERVTGQHIPVIAMTAAAMQGDRERCLQAGMDDYLTKPIRSDSLAAALSRWITTPALPAASSPLRSETDPGPGGPLDSNRLAVLRDLDGGDGELLDAIFHEYTTDSARLIAALGQALGEGDPHTIERHGHTLKGASANLGATHLAELAGQLEMLGRAGALDTAPNILAELETEYAKVTVALQCLSERA
jgi:PAS domain S-box-containing protein